MPVLYPPESEYAKEMAKWEAYHSQYGPPGRPFVHRDYPVMMYRIVELNPLNYVYEEAKDEEAKRAFLSRGWGVGLKGAEEAYHKQQLELAKLAANRAFQEQRMSEKAQAEAAAFEADADEHVAEIPEAPKRKPGRPKKED